jgi:hypothetical protein
MPLSGPRAGLPWETMRQSLGVWWKTASMVMGSPSHAFSVMHRDRGLGQPMMYSIYAMAQPLAVAAMLGIPLMLILGVAAGGDNAGAAVLGMLIFAGMMLLFGLLYLLLVSTIGMMISAAFYHLMLMLVGGARHSYETTFRVNSYAFGSLAWLIFIPYIGGTVASIWLIVLLIIGLSKAHEIPAGKAALAVLLPYLLCVGAAMILFLISMLGAAVQG